MVRMNFFGRAEPTLQSRDFLQRPPPLPESRIRELTRRPHVVKARDSTDGSSNSVTSGGFNTWPIIIGVIVPVLIIAIILLVIWRRRRAFKKREKANDKYKSLDYGVDGAPVKEKNGRKKLRKDGPEMTVTDPTSTKRERGISMDLGTVNPYVLPPGVHQSRDSLQSLSRSINIGDDKYHATTFIPDDGSIRSPSSLRSGNNSPSMWTGSIHQRFETESKTELLSQTPPPETAETPNLSIPHPTARKPQTGLLAPTAPGLNRDSTLSTVSSNAGVNALRASNNYLSAYIRGGQTTIVPEKTEKSTFHAVVTEADPSPIAELPCELPAAVIQHQPPKRQSSFHESTPIDHTSLEHKTMHTARKASEIDLSQHGHREPALPRTGPPPHELGNSSKPQFSEQSRNIRGAINHRPRVSEQNPEEPIVAKVEGQHNVRQPREDGPPENIGENGTGEYQDYLDYTYRGSMMGVRPLPPDDPSENPEQRANRIRSFYKEYFDDGVNGVKPGQPHPTNYFDGSEQFEEGFGYYERPPAQVYSRGPSVYSTVDKRHRSMSHDSHGYYNGPRPYSGMSGQMGPRSSAKNVPKKKLPPPKPLMVLPTPHKLNNSDGDFLPNVVDFAPPQAFRNQRSGTPDSLYGGLKPYSPSVRAHVPLNSSFDDLAVIPSP